MHCCISIRPQHEEAFVTLAMLNIESARTRMPLVCTVISMLVLTVFVALSYVSWLVETNTSAREGQNAKSIQVAPTANSATNVSLVDPYDRYATESWVRHGREF
jgi:hypothetical protein